MRRPVACRVCGSDSVLVARSLGVCANCVRDRPEEALPHAKAIHALVRRQFGLPEEPPRDADGIACDVCANECRIGSGGVGYCGLRSNVAGAMESRTSTDDGLFHAYTDPQVTNCCAAWFCPAGTGSGYPKYACSDGPEHGHFNLAVFLYGCNFDCLFCQNSSHKHLEHLQARGADDLVRITQRDDRISCWCFFGGSPEPQLPFAIEASRQALEAAADGRVLRICFEWNGNGNPKLVERAAALALKSGGNLKFDLKTRDENLSRALSGVSNRRAYENFERLHRTLRGQREGLPVLTATTLLIPGYVDAQEVEQIASFLAALDPGIPYSMLVFHPDFFMDDLPITPASQVEECRQAAEKHLENVHVGNAHLLA